MNCDLTYFGYPANTPPDILDQVVSLDIIMCFIENEKTLKGSTRKNLINFVEAEKMKMFKQSDLEPRG